MQKKEPHEIVAAIDPGLRNLGICVFDITKYQLVYWASMSVVPSDVKNCNKLSYDKVHEYTLAWLQRPSIHYQLERCQTVLVEGQMKKRFIFQQGVLMGALGSKARVLSAATVKHHYGLAKGDHGANKQAVIDYVKRHWGAAEELSQRDNSGKLDDLCDARLMITYYLTCLHKPKYYNF